jgi:hypothetical protein
MKTREKKETAHESWDTSHLWDSPHYNHEHVWFDGIGDWI